jgi:hypothetical protein
VLQGYINFLLYSITNFVRTPESVVRIFEYDGNQPHPELNKTKGSEVDKVKRKFLSGFSENERFKFKTDVSCVLEGQTHLIRKNLMPSMLVTVSVTSK